MYKSIGRLVVFIKQKVMGFGLRFYWRIMKRKGLSRDEKSIT